MGAEQLAAKVYQCGVSFSKPVRGAPVADDVDDLGG
jgi:hypothetical protein